jgi:hypothetical protein
MRLSTGSVIQQVRKEGSPPADAKSGEITIAVADAGCAEASEVVRTAEKLERAYTNELLREKKGQYIAWRELQAQALARAKRLLARG